MNIRDFEENVAFYCEKKSISKAELAEKMSVHPASLSRALHGNPQLDTIIKIAAALEVSVADLFRTYKEIDGIARIGNDFVLFHSIEDLQKQYDSIVAKHNPFDGITWE